MTIGEDSVVVLDGIRKFHFLCFDWPGVFGEMFYWLGGHVGALFFGRRNPLSSVQV